MTKHPGGVSIGCGHDSGYLVRDDGEPEYCALCFLLGKLSGTRKEKERLRAVMTNGFLMFIKDAFSSEEGMRDD